MDEDRIRPAAEKLTAIKLDVSIRPAAFQILKPLFFGDHPTVLPDREPPVRSEHSPADDAARFFGSFEHDKPDENVHLIVAWLYSQYGLYPIATSEVRDTAAAFGLTVPARPDATMRAARRKGKTLYVKRQNGYQLTVHGEAYVKTAYKIAKGTGTRPTVDKE